MEGGGSLFFFVLEVRWKATILFYMFLFFVKISWHALTQEGGMVKTNSNNRVTVCEKSKKININQYIKKQTLKSLEREKGKKKRKEAKSIGGA